MPLRITIYMTFQLGRDTTATVARSIGGLLHRLLTLTACAAVVFFCPTAPSRTPFFRKAGALCCPDFPHCLRSATGRPAIGRKINYFPCARYFSLQKPDARKKLASEACRLHTTVFQEPSGRRCSKAISAPLIALPATAISSRISLEQLQT